jgi:hypothetical protein
MHASDKKTVNKGMTAEYLISLFKSFIDGDLEKL